MMEFVDVIVVATGREAQVPADWLDSPGIGGQFKRVDPQAPPPPTEEPPSSGNPDVQTVFGDEDTEPIRPAFRSDFVDPDEADLGTPLEFPTEQDTHAVIDAFADAWSIDLGDARTKAEKLAVIDEAFTNPDDTEPSTNTPANGDEEN
jgi:hypothetical protein